MKSILGKIWRSFGLSKSIQLRVMRLFQDQFLVGVTGIIQNEKKEILLFKHTYRPHAWSLPGGYLKKGESPQTGLEREIQEESGLVVSVDSLLKIRTDPNEARLDICYTGVLIGGEFVPTHEVSEFGFFSRDNFPLLRNNQTFLIDEVLRNTESL